jgi:hypothetical protein
MDGASMGLTERCIFKLGTYGMQVIRRHTVKAYVHERKNLL